MTLNPHAIRSTSPVVLFHSAVASRQLILSLVKRDVVGRYKGSALGLLWSFFNPILMLSVYTFVFSIVFKARWTDASESRVEFALVLFAGLMVFNLFSECVTRAPNLVISNANYVKKVIFPLEVLPIVAMGSALFHFFINIAVWLVFCVAFFRTPSVQIGLLPVVVLPLLLITLGVSWFLASLGVYLRDVAQVAGVGVTVLMFLSPIFYPLEALPAAYRVAVGFSPLTAVVEQVRDLMIWNRGVDWATWSIQFLVSAAVGWAGFAWFQKTRRGFADVL